MIQDTSRDAYHLLEKVSDKQLSILHAIAVLHSANDRMIAEALKWSINRVTGRRNELVGMGLLTPARKQIDPVTKRRVIFWQLNY